MIRKALFAIILLTTIPALAQTYTVRDVVDGDTITLTNGEIVHLIGIDAPERWPNDKAKKEAERTEQNIETITKMGHESREFVKRLGRIGKEVLLKFDAQKKDEQGRLLAYVYLRLNPLDRRFRYEIESPIHVYKTLNGIPYSFLNATIIKAGYATPMLIPPNKKHVKLFKKLYKEAKEQKRGLWAKCSSDSECAKVSCKSSSTPERGKWKPYCLGNECKCF